MREFGNELIGRKYMAPNASSFTVTAIEPYPKDKVSESYREILDLPPGMLVAVPYRGTLIPNITLKGGVARLTEVTDAGGKVYKQPKAISAALGIRYPFAGYRIKKG